MCFAKHRMLVGGIAGAVPAAASLWGWSAYREQALQEYALVLKYETTPEVKFCELLVGTNIAQRLFLNEHDWDASGHLRRCVVYVKGSRRNDGAISVDKSLDFFGRPTSLATIPKKAIVAEYPVNVSGNMAEWIEKVEQGH